MPSILGDMQSVLLLMWFVIGDSSLFTFFHSYLQTDQVNGLLL